jgi:hypothetical protein
MTSITPSSDSPVPSQVPDTLSPQYLQAMQIVAKMKESADKHGVGLRRWLRWPRWKEIHDDKHESRRHTVPPT